MLGMHALRVTILTVSVALLAACTVVEVRPIVRAQHDVRHVCIERNERVLMAGFLPWLQQSFADHGITTSTYTGKPPDDCEYTASYVANWNWDMSMYLTDANVQLRRGGEVIGIANYHLRGKGGLALNKWASVDRKMRPLMERMLADYSTGLVVPPAPSDPVPAGSSD